MAIIDSNGSFVKTNPACTETLGYSETELVVKPFIEFVHPEDKQSTLDEMARQRQRGYTINFENRYICKDGSVRWLSWRAIYNKEEGITYATARDVTEHKQAEARIRRLVEANIIGIIFFDMTGNITEANEAFLSMIGYSRDDLLSGKVQWTDMTPPEWRAQDELAIEEIRATGKWKAIEKEYFRSDGTRVPILLGGAMLDRSPDQGVAFVLDLTEHKRAEEKIRKAHEELEQRVIERTKELSEANIKLKELDRLKSMFIASMSHELRTPLNSIIGFTGMTLQGMSGELNDEQKDNLTRAYSSAKHLLSLITDVIDISKIEAGRIEAYPETFPLREMVDEAIATIEPQLKKKGLTLEIDVPPDINLITDKKRLVQCLINLLINAVKYTESGGVTVSSRGTDGQVFLCVIDTGIGISEEDIHRLFKPFERLENHLRVKAGGTGLGLYLTKKLVTDVLHGDVSVESVKGQGSTFTIKVPGDIRQTQKVSIEQSGGDIL